jgi:ribosomal-protein-alanine N-acetyltransferase
MADVPELLRLEALFPSDRMAARTLRRFMRSPTAHFWVADSDARVLGNLLMLRRKTSATARIYSVIVDPAARGMGLGAKLVTTAEAEARRLGLARMSLEVRADNTAARAMYARLGYAEAAQLPGYYDDGGDGLRLVKALAENA